MDSWQHLICLYEEWRSLTNREGKAIGEGDLSQLTDCQDQKELLQVKIDALENFLRSAGDWIAPSRRLFRNDVELLIQELIALERRNQTLLESKKHDIEDRQNELLHVTRKLRRVHKAYAASAPSAWHSYS